MQPSEATTLFDYLYSEAAVLLTRAGHSPGDIGFLEFVEATPRLQA